MNILTMGVSGCGKSTIGRQIAKHFDLSFIEGDDFHPPANVAKMAAGNSLNDEDRQPWLEALAEILAKAEVPPKTSHEAPLHIRSKQRRGSVVACSALKEAYRETLREPLKDNLYIVWLAGSREVLLSRLQSRKDHFFPPALLDSQLDTLEPPSDAIRIDVDQSIEEIIGKAISALSSK